MKKQFVYRIENNKIVKKSTIDTDAAGQKVWKRRRISNPMDLKKILDLKNEISVLQKKYRKKIIAYASVASYWKKQAKKYKELYSCDAKIQKTSERSKK